MATGGHSSDGDSLAGLFDASPDVPVHISVAAEVGFLLGLFALFSAPFSVMTALTLGSAVLAVVLGFVGLATTSRPYVAGSALVPAALSCALVALVLVGLRYLGLDTAFGDDLLPVVGDWLTTLNGRLLES